MNQPQRVEGEAELKCGADKFFDVWAQKPYLVTKMCPNKYPKIELHQGDWNKVGAYMTWTYVCNELDEHDFVTIGIEEFNEEKKVVRYSYHDGVIVKELYKTIKSMIQVTSKEEGCIVKWSFEYEKKKDDAPDAKMYIDFLLGVAKDIDASLNIA